jgi:sodium/potassium-transporting ATPase subunit alpha
MITGDHALTAASIARQTGILTLPTREEVAATLGVPPERVPLGDPRVGALVLTGAQLAALTEDSEWDAVMAKKELVFARTSPAQKLRLVKEYQARNHVVAMTGDGVNDSPALKRADVGVAMGSPDASEVAREAADIILLDDDFSRLVAAVEEGRVLFDNVRAPEMDIAARLHVLTQARYLFCLRS